MPESAGLCLLGAAIATFVSLAWLALAMDGHWQQVHGETRPAPVVRVALRMSGVVGLVASALLCFVADRPSMAVLVWLMLLAGAVPVIGLTLAWRPRMLRAVWPRM